MVRPFLLNNPNRRIIFSFIYVWPRVWRSLRVIWAVVVLLTYDGGDPRVFEEERWSKTTEWQRRTLSRKMRILDDFTMKRRSSGEWDQCWLTREVYVDNGSQEESRSRSNTHYYGRNMCLQTQGSGYPCGTPSLLWTEGPQRSNFPRVHVCVLCVSFYYRHPIHDF